MRVGKNTLRPASVEFFVPAQKIMRAAGGKPVQTKAQRSGFRLRSCQFFDTISKGKLTLAFAEVFGYAYSSSLFREFAFGLVAA